MKLFFLCICFRRLRIEPVKPSNDNLNLELERNDPHETDNNAFNWLAVYQNAAHPAAAGLGGGYAAPHLEQS